MWAAAVKVAICIPTFGDVKAGFVSSLARMIPATLASVRGLEMDTFIAHGSILVQARTSLFGWARDWGADRILWLDADHVFPADALVRLLLWRQPMVGANYPRRHDALVPTALAADGQGGWRLVESSAQKAAAQPLEAVDRIGLGLALMDVATVLQAVTAAGRPLFETRAHADGTIEGEDWLLCDLLRAQGVPIHVDHALSRATGHIRDQPLFFA
ncbi:hypothetical protein [Sphingomonas adhaesiva]|uniref:hypothetical protein n=1 Tax=Sphingomonas adhaesiva TaxID=28212 RepID=UPI002FFB7927